LKNEGKIPGISPGKQKIIPRSWSYDGLVFRQTRKGLLGWISEKKNFQTHPAWRFFISIGTHGTIDGQGNEKVSKSGTECSE
jgi:hypothetical protein